MKRPIALIAAMTALLSLGACGIGPVNVADDGDAPNRSTSGLGNGSTPLKRSAQRITDVPTLVDEYLTAAAAGLANRVEIVSSYYEGSTTGPTQPEGAPNIVNVIDTGKPYSDPKGGVGAQSIEVSVQHVGILGADGRLTPTSRGRETYTFTVLTRADGIVFSKVPPDLLLSEKGLQRYYNLKPLYYRSGTDLVPDLRYVPKALNVFAESNRLLELLFAGPAKYLSPSVDPIPVQPRQLDSVEIKDGVITVDLPSPVAEADLAKLAEQLARTLLSGQLTSLRLRVQGQAKMTVPVVPPKVSEAPRRYGIIGGTVYRLKSNVESDTKLLGDQPDLNKAVIYAAVSKREESIALVRPEGLGQRLTIVSKAHPKGMPIDLPSIPTAQPMWLDEGTNLLVQANEELYQVNVQTGAWTRATARVEGLTHVSVAPDGHRVTLVIGGSLYLASRDSDGQIEVDFKQLVPTGFNPVQSAAFNDLSRDKLVVAGTEDGGTYICTVLFDGTDRSRYERKSSSQIRYLVAKNSQTLYYESQGNSYEASQYGDGKDLGSDVETAGATLSVPVIVKMPSFEG